MGRRFRQGNTPDPACLCRVRSPNFCHLARVLFVPHHVVQHGFIGVLYLGRHDMAVRPQLLAHWDGRNAIHDGQQFTDGILALHPKV